MRYATLLAIATLQVAAVFNVGAQSPAGYTPWRLPLSRPVEVSYAPSPLRSGAIQTAAAPGLAAAVVHNDIDGDGKSDLMWALTYSKSPSTHNFFSYWRMDGASHVSGHNFVVPDEYTYWPSGDFNGDGRSDILFNGRRDSFHPNLWLSRGDGGFDTTYLTGSVIPAGTGWSLTHLPNNVDLNADGKDDVLLRNRTAGQAAYLLMNAPTVSGSVVFDLDPGYEMVGAGDFDGDGLGDLLCAQTALGHLYLWRNRGDGGFDVSLIAVYDPTWKIEGNPDLNGDGRSDIAWGHAGLGMLAFWWLDGATVLRAESRWAGQSSSGVATGDFDGDGIGDVAWEQNSTGYLFLWRSRGDGDFDGYLVAHISPYWFLLR